MNPNPKIIEILADAHAPCVHFKTCPEAHWDPLNGHIPRGICGAIGALSEVECIFVMAEPGHPHLEEKYFVDDPWKTAVAACSYSYRAFRDGKDQYHRNVREFINCVWPNRSFDEQLRRVLLTESRLCSIDDEIGQPTSAYQELCAQTYLAKQIEILPQAIVVAFGVKAKRRIRSLVGSELIKTASLAPPGCNHSRSKESQRNAIAELRESLGNY